MPPTLPGIPPAALIAQKVRDLRKGRGLTQGQLARWLGLSTSRLCEIEKGQGTFTAGQLIFLLKYFNVPLSHFDEETGAQEDAIQKALARHGAGHLVENRDLLPSERLEQVDAVIREALLDGGSARWITALAPVLVLNIDRVNLPKLFAQFRDYGLQRRFLWLIDNVVEALREFRDERLPRKEKVLLARALAALDLFREGLPHLVQEEPNGPEDTLGPGLLSPESREEVRADASKISNRWRILTPIQVADFRDALEESHVLNPSHRAVPPGP